MRTTIPRRTVGVSRLVEFPYHAWSTYQPAYAGRSPKSSGVSPIHWWRWAGFLLVVGCLVLCHGCHGEDKDDELCLPTWSEGVK
jgi:hypothetical protein